MGLGRAAGTCGDSAIEHFEVGGDLHSLASVNIGTSATAVRDAVAKDNLSK